MADDTRFRSMVRDRLVRVETKLSRFVEDAEVRGKRVDQMCDRVEKFLDEWDDFKREWDEEAEYAEDRGPNSHYVEAVSGGARK